MKEKIPSEIIRLTLDDASYKGCGVSITPTIINFFFGNNGTGKSTIGRAIKVNSGVTWQEGRFVSDYTVHVYNQEFISANIQNYHNLPGVFTVNEINIAIQQQVEAKMVEKEKASAALNEATEARIKKTAALEQASDLFQKRCWDKTNALRHDFDKTQEKRKTKKAFAEAVLAVKTSKEHDLEALRRLHDAAYSDDAKKYEMFSTIADTAVLDNLIGREILEQKIVSSANTPFAQFIKAINATTWVQQGHEQYHIASDGKCPYCQQKLPDSFEDDIRNCFNSQYQDAIQALSNYYDTYRNAANALFIPLQKTPTELLPGLDTTVYFDKLAAIKGMISTNLQKIRDKMADPTLEVKIKDVAIKLEELSDIIEGFKADT